VLNAYYASIAFMSLIPLGIIGAVLTWIYRQTHPRRKKQKTNKLDNVTLRNVISSEVRNLLQKDSSLRSE
jgi:uncharacterized membrane protein